MQLQRCAAFLVGELGNDALDGPAEAAGAVLVHGFEHEEDGTDLEDCGAHECGDAATV